MTPLKNQHVLILGLGESGLAMARWCANEGASVHVADTRSLEAGGPPQLDTLKNSLPDIQITLGAAWNASLLDGIDLIAISPGLSPLQSPQREVLAIASERNIPVWGEIELFAQKLAALKTEQAYTPKLLAITGTNGKTTVTSLTGKLCERAGLKTRVAGNISPAALNALADALAQNELPDVWVLELSSFQLETTRSLAADAATVLNITQDHLDWHGDMQAYAAAKARIFAPDTVRILNRDDARVMAMTAGVTGVTSAQATVSFGLDVPEYAGQFGALTEGGMRWLALREPSEQDEPRPSIRQKKLGLEATPPDPGLLKRLMPTEALQIRGDHNIANALAALALCRAIGLPMAPLLHGLREYRGEPHRVEWLMSVDDVDYVDDSKGTNVGATVAALNGLATSHANGRIVLIAGGDGKGQDFAPLKEPVQRNARAVVLIGKDAAAIHLALHGSGITVTTCESLPAAVQTAAALAMPGDTVLLSPACASLDMFRNYKHRADVFTDAVRELALEAGQPC